MVHKYSKLRIVKTLNKGGDFVKISLKAARVNANLTQNEVAQAVGVTGKTVSNWETGETEIKMSSLIVLGNLYDVPVGDFILPNSSQ